MTIATEILTGSRTLRDINYKCMNEELKTFYLNNSTRYYFEDASSIDVFQDGKVVAYLEKFFAP